MQETPTRGPQTRNSFNAKLVAIDDDNIAIEIRDEHTKTECAITFGSQWMFITEALHGPDEVHTWENLIKMIQIVWPAVNPDMFRLRIIKLVENYDGEFYFGDEPDVFCQVRLGVIEEYNDGSMGCRSIVIGPRVRYREDHGKRPEYEHEHFSVKCLLKGMIQCLTTLSDTERKRVAEDTYEGSTVCVKKTKIQGGRADDAIVLD